MISRNVFRNRQEFVDGFLFMIYNFLNEKCGDTRTALKVLGVNESMNSAVQVTPDGIHVPLQEALELLDHNGKFPVAIFTIQKLEEHLFNLLGVYPEAGGSQKFRVYQLSDHIVRSSDMVELVEDVIPTSSSDTAKIREGLRPYIPLDYGIVIVCEEPKEDEFFTQIGYWIKGMEPEMVENAN